MHWLLLILRDARTRVRSLPNVFGVRAPQDEDEHRVVHSSRFQTAHLVLATRLASEACDYCFAHPNEGGRSADPPPAHPHVASGCPRLLQALIFLLLRLPHATSTLLRVHHSELG